MFFSKNGNYRKSIVRRLELLFPEDEEALLCEEDVEVPLLRKSSVWREELLPVDVDERGKAYVCRGLRHFF